MARQNERSANGALARLLRGMMHGCDVVAESSRTIAGHSGLQPDVLIMASERAPVAIEAEYMPASEVEEDARRRLGLEAVAAAREIEAVIALRYPEGVEYAQDLEAAIGGARLSYCVLMMGVDSRSPIGVGDMLRGNDERKRGNVGSEGGNDGSDGGRDGGSYERFPEAGWLEGSVGDVAELARLVSVPQSAVNAAASALEAGIDGAVGVLNDMERLSPVAAREVADLLGMTDVPQTRRMACAIVANAMVFHDRIAHMHPEILPLNRLWEGGADNPQGKVSESWDAILRINYWPIFAVARDIVNLLPSYAAAQILERLRGTAQGINSTGANIAHDLTGRVFQELIVDRKYLATFYTLPASAALLARLAVAKLEGVDWSDAEAIGGLRVGDFACGTGALLSAVYEQMATRHERAGGNPAALHRAMMEDALYGCDVMPSAIHITSSTLSGREPNVGFGGSRLYNMPYGRQSDGTVAIGSLELLQSSSVMTLFNTSDPAMRTGSAGEETAARVLVDVPDDGFDLVIMNPPFTSNTKHYDAGDGVLNAAFAAFNASKKEQDDMAARMREKSRNTCYHGHAGLGSAFAALGDNKVKPGGVVAFVLPFTAINGASWAKFRELIATRYTDVTVVSIAANGKDMSFSSDTGMAECLILGRKLRRNEKASLRANFVSLRRRPGGFVHALEVSKGISQSLDVRKIEDGPYGGNSIYCGEEHSGELLDAPIDGYKDGWGAARIEDAAVAQTAQALANGKLWLPSQLEPLTLPIAQLKGIGQRGHDHQLFISAAHRGPFTKERASSAATYPSLWNHNAQNERRMICEPDSQMTVKRGMEERAYELWQTASRSHLTLDFRFTSQPLSVAFTERKSIGGTAWPNVSFEDERYDYAFAVWGNSTLGLLSYWWHSSRQQDGRGRTTMRTIETMPILDLRALSDAQLDTAREVFEEFRGLELRPAYLADRDANRALLDRRVVCDVLGLGEDVYDGVRLVAGKWCGEPSVHGGKGRRK